MPKGPFDQRAESIPKNRDLAELLPKFETEETCCADSEKVGKALQRHSKDGRRVARRLLACVREHDERCNSGACRRCLRAFRRELFVSASALSDLCLSGRDTCGFVVSIIPAGLQAPAGKLKRLDLKSISLRLWRTIHRMDLGCPVIGGIDVSYNEDARGLVAPHWQVHFAFAVLGARVQPAIQKRLRRKIDSAFKLEPTAKRPVKIQVLEDHPRQLSYLLKSSFARRVSVIDARGRANALNFPLKTRERVELALWLDSYPIATRLVLSGVRRHGATLQLNLRLDSPRPK